MKLTHRPAGARGLTDLDWLDSRHTFSFGDYYDRRHMGFGPLRVINEDRVQPGQGFGTHGHQDMEIISYVLEGALEHKDSIGTGSIIRPGDVQRMSAGSGIRHSEFNPSKSEPVHFLQIWLMPDQQGLPPSYEQKNFTDSDKQGRLRLIASPDAAEGSVVIHLDARVYAARLNADEQVGYAPKPGRLVWIQLAHGKLGIGGMELTAGDGAAMEKESNLLLTGKADGTELLLFDMR